MMEKIVGMIERLDLSSHRTMIGVHFPEIIGLLAIIFGGSFLLFAWKHHEYFLGITGLLVGSWAGLIIKSHVGATGEIPAVLYLAVCAVAGAASTSNTVTPGSLRTKSERSDRTGYDDYGHTTMVMNGWHRIWIVELSSCRF